MAREFLPAEALDEQRLGDWTYPILTLLGRPARGFGFIPSR